MESAITADLAEWQTVHTAPCAHADLIPGLDADGCPICRKWFVSPEAIEASQTRKRGKK